MALSQEGLEAALLSAKESIAGETPGQFSIHIFHRLASTNQTLWGLIDAGAGAGTVCIALEQTAGRGQWGRTWQSGAGGLYLSLAIEPDLPLSDSAQLTLCGALGIARGLRNCGIPAGLKWPNDIVLAGGKLGGILTETRARSGFITKAVVGAGINWANEVPPTGINLQSFQANLLPPPIPSLEMLAAVTLLGLASGYRQAAREGIAGLLPSYLELLTNIGQPAVVDGRAGTVTGVSPTLELIVRFPPDSAESGQLPGPAGEIRLKPGTISLGYNR
ncbi:biotin--[acetyl-CoA-carboxylase] ligase [Kamptonema formosum]|uniref:biotin--[acetyl-CoA-carboxylase] ligase n=1 Tax=Kamptonema formosum TaxID=331992 RepID=UPI00034B7E89|nr:biotin--[acetyl-CoA-carboxylase] ligase [Oscillatoria sp. PCC 10802]